MKKQKSPRSGFTLIELLTVIAIIGILAAILIPSVGAVRKKAAQAASSSDMRQIYIAHANYQNDGSRTRSMGSGTFASPNATNLAQTPADFAKVLAWYTELNEAPLFFIKSAEDVATLDPLPRIIFRGSGNERTVDPDFTAAENNISYNMARVSANASGTTPLIWTKGLEADGTWTADTELSPWGDEGGHIIYSAGNVEFFKVIESGDLRDPSGQPITDIEQAFTNSTRILTIAE